MASEFERILAGIPTMRRVGTQTTRGMGSTYSRAITQGISEADRLSQAQSILKARQQEKLFNQFFGGAGGGFAGMFGGGAGGGFDALLKSVHDDLAKVGDARRAAIDEEFGESLNNQLAYLQDRGLGSSNMAGNAFTGVERDKQMAVTDLESKLAGQRASATQTIGLAGLQNQQDLLAQLLGMFGLS